MDWTAAAGKETERAANVFKAEKGGGDKKSECLVKWRSKEHFSVLRSPSVRRNSLTTRCGPHRIVRFLRSLERHKSKTMEGQEGRNPGTQERKDGMPESQLLKEPTNDGVGRGRVEANKSRVPDFDFWEPSPHWPFVQETRVLSLS